MANNITSQHLLHMEVTNLKFDITLFLKISRLPEATIVFNTQLFWTSREIYDGIVLVNLQRKDETLQYIIIKDSAQNTHVSAYCA